MIDQPVIGFTCSTFDLLHAGHILMLKEAASVCDYLIVGIQTDPTIDRPQKNKPIQSLDERLIQLEAVKYVDSIFVYTTEDELLELITNLDIDTRIVGADYLGKDFTGKQYCEDNGIAIYYNSRDHNYSTTELRERVARHEAKEWH